MTSVTIETAKRHRLVRRALGAGLRRQRNQTRRKELWSARDRTVSVGSYVIHSNYTLNSMVSSQDNPPRVFRIAYHKNRCFPHVLNSRQPESQRLEKAEDYFRQMTMIRPMMSAGRFVGGGLSSTREPTPWTSLVPSEVLTMPLMRRAWNG